MSDLFLGRTDNVAIRFAAAVALLFNVLMVIIAIIAIIVTVPKDDRCRSERDFGLKCYVGFNVLN